VSAGKREEREHAQGLKCCLQTANDVERARDIGKLAILVSHALLLGDRRNWCSVSALGLILRLTIRNVTLGAKHECVSFYFWTEIKWLNLWSVWSF
jgi:hypothetical protein